MHEFYHAVVGGGAVALELNSARNVLNVTSFLSFALAKSKPAEGTFLYNIHVKHFFQFFLQLFQIWL
jgi:hypothetical protein